MKNTLANPQMEVFLRDADYIDIKHIKAQTGFKTHMGTCKVGRLLITYTNSVWPLAFQHDDQEPA